MSDTSIHNIYWPSQSVKMFPATYSGNQGNYMNEQNLSSVLSPLKIKNTKRLETDFAITPIENATGNKFIVDKGDAYINGYLAKISTQKEVAVTYSEGKTFAERIHYWLQLMRDGNNIIKQPNSDNMFVGIDLFYDWNPGAWKDVKSELIATGAAEEDVFYLGYTENYAFVNAANYSSITGPNIISNSSLTYLTFNDTDIQVTGDFWVNGELHLPSGWFEDTIYNENVDLATFQSNSNKGWNKTSYSFEDTEYDSNYDNEVFLADTNIAIGGQVLVGEDIEQRVPIRLTLKNDIYSKTINLDTSLRSDFELYGYPFYNAETKNQIKILRKKSTITGAEDGSYIAYEEVSESDNSYVCKYNFLINYQSLIDRTTLFNAETTNLLNFSNTSVSTEPDCHHGYNHYSDLQTEHLTTHYAKDLGIQNEPSNSVIAKISYGNPRFNLPTEDRTQWKYDVNRQVYVTWTELGATLSTSQVVGSSHIRRGKDGDGNIIWYVVLDSSITEGGTTYFNTPERPVIIQYYSMRQSLRGGTSLANLQAFDTIYDLVSSKVKASIITNAYKWVDHNYRLTKESVIESNDFNGYRQGLADLPDSVDPDEEGFIELLSDTERSLYYRTVLFPWYQAVNTEYSSFVTGTVPNVDDAVAIEKSEHSYNDPYSSKTLTPLQVATKYRQILKLYNNLDSLKRSTKVDSKGFRIHAPSLIEIANDDFAINTESENWGKVAVKSKTTLAANKIGYSYYNKKHQLQGPFGFFDYPAESLIGEYERDLVVNEYGLDGTGFERFNMLQPINKDSYPFVGKSTTVAAIESGDYNRILITLDPYNQFQSVSPINNAYLNDTFLFANKKTSKSTFVNTFAVPIIELDSNGNISSGGKIIFNKLDGSRGQGLHRKGNSEPANPSDYNNNAAVELSTYSWKNNDKPIGLSVSGNRRLSGEESTSIHTEIPLYSSGTMHTHSSVRPTIQSVDKVIMNEEVLISDYAAGKGRLLNVPVKSTQITFTYQKTGSDLSIYSETVNVSSEGIFETGLEGRTAPYYVTVSSYITTNETYTDSSSSVCDFTMDINKAYKNAPVVTTNEVAGAYGTDEDLYYMWQTGILNYVRTSSDARFDQKRLRSPNPATNLFYPSIPHNWESKKSWNEWLYNTVPAEDRKEFVQYEQDIVKKKHSRFKNNSVPSLIYKNSIKINSGTILPSWQSYESEDDAVDSWNMETTTYIYNLFDVPSEFDCDNIHVKVSRKRTHNTFLASRLSGEMVGLDMDQDDVRYYVNCVESISPDISDEDIGIWSWGKKFAYDPDVDNDMVGTEILKIKKAISGTNTPQKSQTAGYKTVKLVDDDLLVRPTNDEEPTITIYNPFREKLAYTVDYHTSEVTFYMTDKDIQADDQFSIEYKYYKTYDVSVGISELMLKKLKQSVDGNASISMAGSGEYKRRIIGNAGAFAFKLVLDPGTMDLYLDVIEDVVSDKRKIDRGDYYAFSSTDMDKFTSDRILLGHIKFDESRTSGTEFYFESTSPVVPSLTDYREDFPNETLTLIDFTKYGYDEGQTVPPEYLTIYDTSTTSPKLKIDSNCYLPLNYTHIKVTLEYATSSGPVFYFTQSRPDGTEDVDSMYGYFIPKSGYVDVKFDEIECIGAPTTECNLVDGEENVVRARIYADGSFRFMNTSIRYIYQGTIYTIQVLNDGNFKLFINYMEIKRECQNPETYESWLGNIFRVQDLDETKIHVSQSSEKLYKPYQSFMIPNNTINRYQLVMNFYNCEHDQITNAITNNVEFDIEATYDGDEELKIKRNNLASCGDYFEIPPKDLSMNCDTTSAPGVIVGVCVATNDQRNEGTGALPISSCSYKNFAILQAGGSDLTGKYRRNHQLREAPLDDTKLFKGNNDIFSTEDMIMIGARIYRCMTDWSGGKTSTPLIRQIKVRFFEEQTYTEEGTGKKYIKEQEVSGSPVLLNSNEDYFVISSASNDYVDVAVAITNMYDGNQYWNPSESFQKEHRGLPSYINEWASWYLPVPLTFGECLIRKLDPGNTSWKFRSIFTDHLITKIIFCINCSDVDFT